MNLGYRVMLYFVQHLLPGFRLTRQRNLALVALGIAGVRDGHLTMSEIARSVPTRSDHWYKFKRIRRFLSNLKWSPSELFGDLVRFALQRFHPGHYVPVIFDQSTIGGRWEALWASLPFRGRALPIAFQLFRYEEISQDEWGNQHKIEEAFIRKVVENLPTSPPPLLLFDRGYARVSFFRFLDSLEVKYVVRAPKNVWVQHRHSYAGPLSGIDVTRGTLLWWPRTYYQKAKPYLVNLAITLNATAEEPWYLVTNLKRACSAVRWYERRFRCEVVCSQITKTCLLTRFTGGDDVADLHLVVGDDHTVDEKLDQLPALLECGLVQPLLHTLTECLDGGRDAGHFELFLSLRFHLAQLGLQGLFVLRDISALALQLRQIDHLRQIRLQEAIVLAF
jgi:hypothetical protein